MSQQALFDKAIKAMQKGDWAKASSKFRAVLRQNPNHLDANYLLGTVFLEVGQLRDAVERLRFAAELDPDSAMIQNNLGHAHLLRGKPDKALPCFRRAVESDPGLFEAQFSLAETLLAMGRVEEAAPHAEQAVALRGTSVPALMLYALILRRVGDVEAAADQLETVLALEPDHVPALHGVGNLTMHAGARDEATRIYQRILAIDPRDESARFALQLLREEVPDRVPEGHLARVFDDLATTFDDHLASIGYQGPQVLFDMLCQEAGADFRAERLLDVGCGTGAVGQRFREVVGHSTGLDVSPNMIERCRAAGIYDALILGGIADLPRDAAFDLVVAADTFPYLGELDGPLAAIHQRMAPGSFLMFTTERCGDADALVPAGLTGRFAAGDGYLARLAAARGFRVRRAAVHNLRMERQQWIEGSFCLWQKA